jgi:NADH-quinone oxidoreductase subunit E
MLTEAERKALDHEAEHYEHKQALTIEALKIVQNHRGWISDESIKDIASYLECDPAEVDSVATFYNLIYRKPVGEKVVHVCTSVSCWIMGSEAIEDRFKNKLGIGYGETTEDGRITLVRNQCLGYCDHAPCLQMNDKMYGDLETEESTDKAIEDIQST